MKTLITNAQILDMVGDIPNVRKVYILINENRIEKIEKLINETEADLKINVQKV